MNPRIVVIMAMMLSLGVSLTIQSASAQPGPTDQPTLVKEILSWCERHPTQLECTIMKPDIKLPEKMIRIQLPPRCPGPVCPDNVILNLNPGEMFVVGKLNNNTIAVKVSAQDVLQMLNNMNVTSNGTSSLAK